MSEIPENKKTKYRGFTPAQAEAHKRYMKDFVEVKVRMKIEKRTTIQEHAAKMGESTTAFINRAIDEAMERDKSINGLNATAASLAEDNQIKPLTAESEQTEAPLPELEPDKHCKPLTEEAENNVNLVKLLADVNYQLDIEDAYGFETLRALLDKARQQESEREEAAQENTTPMSDLNKSDT